MDERSKAPSIKEFELSRRPYMKLMTSNVDYDEGESTCSMSAQGENVHGVSSRFTRAIDETIILSN